MYFFVRPSSSFGNPKTINKTYNSFCTEECLSEIVDGKLQCKCGEDTPCFDWSWENDDSPNIKMSKCSREVLFHPVYSSGTAVVKGNIPFQQNYHYYWEIKVISKLYGTDVMIGVGTARIAQSDWKYRFCSLLGIDSHSWGYSYLGNIQHNYLRRKYGRQFGLGSIIGVHLDMCNGTLEYFLNRQPLGIAFKGLKGKELYPMVCSTAAQSAIRITCCISKEPSLQMLCLSNIVNYPGLYEQYRNIPGLTKAYDRQFFWITPHPEHDEKKRLADLDEDVTLSLVDKNYLNKSKKMKPLRFISMLYDYDDDFYNLDDDAVNNLGNYDSNDAASLSESEGPSTSKNNTCDVKQGRTMNEDANKQCKICDERPIKCTACILRKAVEDEGFSSDSSESTFIF